MNLLPSPLRKYGLILALLLLALSTAPGSRAQEAQVPLDQEGNVDVVAADLEEQLNLFPEYGDFQEARLFQAGDDQYELVIRYRSDGQLLRDQRSLRAEEVQRLRQRISQGVATENVQAAVGLNQEGRYELLAATTLYGAVQGLLIPAALDVESRRVYGSLPFLGAAGGFFVPFLASQNASVTEAQATAVGYGGALGLAHGPLLGGLLLGESLTGQGGAGLAALFNAGEAIVGYQWARRHDAGAVEATGLGGIFGGGLGAGTAALVLGDDSEDTGARLITGTTLLGSVGGAYAGFRLARSADYTKGDARVAGLSGLLGTQAAAAALVLAESEGARPGAALSMGGTLAGLGVGHALVRQRDFSEFQSSIQALGSFAGSLLGNAIAVLATSDEEDSEKVFLSLSTLGSIAGFGLTYISIADEARASGSEFGWRLQVQPAGAVGTLLFSEAHQAPSAAVPLVSLRGTF